MWLLGQCEFCVCLFVWFFFLSGVGGGGGLNLTQIKDGASKQKYSYAVNGYAGKVHLSKGYWKTEIGDFLQIEPQLSMTNAWLPPIFLLDTNNLAKAAFIIYATAGGGGGGRGFFFFQWLVFYIPPQGPYKFS